MIAGRMKVSITNPECSACVQEKQIGTDDRTSIMGYDNLLSCFNLPESAAIGLMSAKQYRPKSLPAGKGVKLRLKPNWGPPPQVQPFRCWAVQGWDARRLHAVAVRLKVLLVLAIRPKLVDMCQCLL